MNWYIALLIVLIIVILVVLVRLKKLASLVKENSAKYIKLRKLNEEFKFHKNVKKEIDINHFAVSKTDLSKLILNELLVEMFRDNTNNIDLNMKYVLENEKKYNNYLNRYNAIDDKTTLEIISVTNMKPKTFEFLENRLFKMAKLNPIVKTKVNIIAKFDTPKGENKYQKKKTYSFGELKDYYKLAKNNTEEK